VASPVWFGSTTTASMSSVPKTASGRGERVEGERVRVKLRRETVSIDEVG